MLIWRKTWRDVLIPRIIEFNPDIIFISAGFDAHHRDLVNDGFIALDENDYAYVTDLIVEAANLCCNGRIVSLLEGGYEIFGELISPFARSVAAHVKSLNVEHNAKWNQKERNQELLLEREAYEKKLEQARLQQQQQAEEMSIENNQQSMDITSHDQVIPRKRSRRARKK